VDQTALGSKRKAGAEELTNEGRKNRLLGGGTPKFPVFHGVGNDFWWMYSTKRVEKENDQVKRWWEGGAERGERL